MRGLDSKTIARLEALKNKALNLVPKGNTTHQKIIIAFEKIAKEFKKHDVMLDSLAAHLYKTKSKDFKTLNNFFEKVHTIIRKEAVKSKYFNANLETAALNNYNENTGFYYGKNDYEKAYHKLLDFYDPNKKQEKRDGYFRWAGFWSLISTKNGIITGCYLSDTHDREMFYEAIPKK